MEESYHKKKTLQYLTFILGKEHFAIEIEKVKEVLEHIPITEVPRTPAAFLGLINLRGNVVPVVDLGMKIGLSPVQKTLDTCIMIIEARIDQEITQIGALADSVKEVIALDPKQVGAPPKLGTKLNAEFIKAVGHQEDHFIIILDIERALIPQ